MARLLLLCLIGWRHNMFHFETFLFKEDLKKMRRLLYLFLGMMLSVGLPFVAHAADNDVEDLRRRVEALEKKTEGFDLSKITVNGFVDTSHFHDDNAGTNTFSLDKVALYGSYDPVDYASLYFDLGYTDAGDDNNANIDQAYVNFTCPLSGIKFTLGKFDAPIGFESVDAPDMYQYSHALVFDNGIALFHTGVMVDRSLVDMIDLKFYAVNGWDNNADNNEEKTYGGRIGIRPIEDVNLGVSYVWGPEGDNNNVDSRQVVDVDLTVTAIPNLTIGGEFNYGLEENASEERSDRDAEWSGGLIMLHYDFCEWSGLTFRYDRFFDKDGGRTDTKQTLQAYTIAPTFTIAEGFGALVEYRRDPIR